ncbi:MAG TPA: N-acetylmuramoyl-L-alanine amidase, partial [Solirubrobacteraceae bacterium]
VGSGRAHAPDGAPRTPASDPVWTGAADELQLRGTGGRELELLFVAVASAPRLPRARAAQGTGGAPVIVTRDQWGARAPKTTPSYGQIGVAFVHHTDNANDYAASESAAIVAAIQRYHMDHNGWNDIGYNFLVDRFGQVFEGRAGGIDQAVIGAHAEGWNSKSTGIATIGVFDAERAPDAATTALVRLLAWKLALHGVPATGASSLLSGGGKANRYAYGTAVTLQHVSGHRDGCKTACPGNGLYAQLPSLRSRAAALQGTVATQPKLTLASSASRLVYGEDAVFNGRLLGADGVPVAGARVSVQKQGGSGWVTLAAAQTQPDGSFSARIPWRRAGNVRARATPPGAGGAIRSPVVSIALTPILRTTHPDARSRVKAGGAVRVRGSVRPADAVAVVVERQGRDGRWHRVRVVRARLDGRRFGATVRLRKAGLYRLTARTDDVRAEPIFVRAVRSAADVGGAAADA